MVPSTASRPARPQESLAYALARRDAVQKIPFDPAADPQALAQRMHGAIAEIATGFQVTAKAVNQALMGQQMQAADDISSLFRDDPHMQMVANQFRAKATGELPGAPRPEAHRPS
jgi:hypothetical protein